MAAFQIITSQVDEIFPPHLRAEIPDYLVRLKAAPFTQLNDDELVITADTIVWSDNQCRKPKNKREASAMLNQLSGKVHEVITSVGFTQKQPTGH